MEPVIEFPVFPSVVTMDTSQDMLSFFPKERLAFDSHQLQSLRFKEVKSAAWGKYKNPFSTVLFWFSRVLRTKHHAYQ